jgi:RNA polymerase sigma-70 factor (ECF subfamily)
MISDEEFRCLVNKYKNMVYNFSCVYINDSEEAKDITQEVFIKLYSYLSWKKVKDIPSFLLKVTKNLCIDYLRKKHKTTQVFKNLIAQKKLENQDNLIVEEKIDINQAIKKLPINYRIALYLRHQEGFSYSEIAKIMKIPIGTVKTLLYRARETLRKNLSS